MTEVSTKLLTEEEKRQLTLLLKKAEITFLHPANYECVKKDDLNTLLTKKEHQDLEIDILKTSVVKIMEVLGIAEKGMVNKKILSGEESFIGPMFKSISKIGVTMGQAELPGSLGRRAKDKLEEQFGFLKPLLPVIEKYTKQ